MKAEEGKKEAITTPVGIALRAIGALIALYVFLVGLSLMGGAFKVLGGKGAGNMYSAVDNPISGLMTGILSTVLVQSSSTSTSVVVSMVADGGLSVKQGIPIIMGANIGTSVTNSIVSMGFSGDRIQLERAFAGATVHDMFNMLAVGTLLPLEIIIGAMAGGGGLLYWLTYELTESLMGGEGGEPLFPSPIKTITKPVVSEILSANKYVIYALTLGAPTAVTPNAVNTTLCEPLTRRLTDSPSTDVKDAGSARSLLSKRSGEPRRLTDLEDCSQYYCVSKVLDKQFKKISKSSYKKLTKCEEMILDDDADPCGSDKCYLDAGAYYDKKVTNGHLIKGGFLEGAGDLGGGIIGLILSLILLSVGMFCLTKCLQYIFMGNAKKIVKYAVKLNDYLALLIGLGITLLVQSSSVTTSALTPLCGIGVLPLVKMLPMTLGANIGTTCTAMIASLVSLKFGAVQIALVHLCFNIIGILVWFPVPLMRRVPLSGARLLGVYAAQYRFVPLVYILIAFVCVPGIALLIGLTFDASVGGGVVLLLFVLALVGAFEFLWLVGYPKDGEWKPLCYRVLSKEQREESLCELAKADAQITGVNVDEEVPAARQADPLSEEVPAAGGPESI